MSTKLPAEVNERKGKNHLASINAAHASLQSLFHGVIDGGHWSRFDRLTRSVNSIEKVKIASARFQGLGKSVSALQAGQDLARSIAQMPPKVRLPNALKIVADGFRILSPIMQSLPAEEKRMVFSHPFDGSKFPFRGSHFKSSEIAAWRDELKDSMGNYLHAAFVHGSASTLDFTDYSDLDDFLIVKKEVATDPDAMLSLCKAGYRNSRWLYRLDPTQHHRHIWITEYDLDYYSADHLPNLPLEVLETAKPLWKTDSLTLRIAPENRAGRLLAWKAMKHALEKFSKSKHRTLWKLKYFVSLISLAPCLAVAAAGKPMAKPQAIAYAKKQLSPSATEVLETATQIRQQWQSRHTMVSRIAKRCFLHESPRPFAYEHTIRSVSPRSKATDKQKTSILQKHLADYLESLDDLVAGKTKTEAESND